MTMKELNILMVLFGERRNKMTNLEVLQVILLYV